jgi:hypothetical protein
MTASFPNPSLVYIPEGDGRIVGQFSKFGIADHVHLVLGLSDILYRAAIPVPLTLNFFCMKGERVGSGFRLKNHLFDYVEID